MQELNEAGDILVADAAESAAGLLRTGAQALVGIRIDSRFSDLGGDKCRYGY